MELKELLKNKDDKHVDVCLKILKTINSCENIGQLSTCEKMIKNYVLLCLDEPKLTKHMDIQFINGYMFKKMVEIFSNNSTCNINQI